MTKKGFLITGLLFLITTWLFVGISRDQEFNQPDLFIKHRPSFKINFHSPGGMSNLTIENLPEPKNQKKLPLRNLYYISMIFMKTPLFCLLYLSNSH